MKHLIFDLRSRHARQLQQAGGKGVGLARLHRLGFDVPEGFVIGTSVFDDTIRSLGIRDCLNQPLSNAETLTQIRKALSHSSIRPAWQNQIISAYCKLGGRVAVRSSMVGEDGARTSLAGQLETVLDIEGEESLLDAVRRCYTAVSSKRLHKYLEQVSSYTDKKPFSLALIIQQMVPAVVVGVAFSADPETGERCVIIEASDKSVEGVSSGTIEPVRWVVDARNVLVESRGVLSADTDITDSHVRQLADTVRKAAIRMGDPQDIEWAWDGKRFWFLQTRPITTLVDKQIFSNRLIADMSPGLVKPLLWSTNTQSMVQNVFGRIFNELIGTNHVDYSNLSKRIHSRIYANMTMLGELLQTIGLPANFFEMMAWDETGERPPFKPSPFYILRRGRLLRFLWKYLSSKKKIEAFVTSQQRDLEPHRRAELTRATIPELEHYFERLLELHGRSQWNVFLAAINMMIRKRLMDRFLKKVSKNVSAADLLYGIKDMNDYGPDNRLKEIASIAHKLGNGMLDIMANSDDSAIRAALKQSSTGQALLVRADEFLHDYGFLSTDGTDFTGKSWVECPDLMWKSLSRTARQLSGCQTDSIPPTERNREDYLRKIIGPVRCIWFKRLLNSTLSFMRLRENASLLLTEDVYQMRRVLLALGEKHKESGRLDEVEDIFYLYIEELRKLNQNKIAIEKVKRIVRERREELEADARLEPLDTICGDTIPSHRTLRIKDSKCLFGIGGSSGIVEGRAVIVQDPLHAPLNLNKQDILVVPFTDIGWTPLFAGIGGIIAETGGQLSHTSIIAREYLLPAVVSVRNATRLLKNGQPITIDGRSGHVHLGHILTNGEGE